MESAILSNNKDFTVYMASIELCNTLFFLYALECI